MSAIIQSLHRDHRNIERLLRVLEQECDVFYRAELSDYELLGNLIGHLDCFLRRYFQPKEDLLLERVRRSNAACAKIIDDVMDKRIKASASLKALSEALRDVLNEQCVSRQTFDNAARSFIRYERQQIEMEERRLFPIARSALSTADWANLHATLRDETLSLRTRELKGHLHNELRWILREGSADRADRIELVEADDK